MSVRIISKRLCKHGTEESKRFWETVEKHQPVIKRCFMHILLKYPTLDSMEDAYNTVLTEFYRKGLFDRFDRRKLVAAKKSVSPDEVSPAECTDEEMEKLGINVGKKFEEFLYVWIHQILREAYKRHGRYIRSMCRTEVGHGNSLQLRAQRGLPTETAWPTTDEDHEEFDHYEQMKNEGRRVRLRPCYLDAGDYRGTASDDPMESAIAQDLVAHLTACITDPKDRMILRLKLDGMTDKDVSTALDIKRSKIRTLRKKAQSLLRSETTTQKTTA